MNTYTLPEHLLQAVVGVLNELPAGRVRGLLNEIEAECTRQDAERAAAAQQALRAQILADVSSKHEVSAGQ